MTISKFIKGAGYTVSILALISVVDFLGGRYMGAWHPFYNKRTTVKPVDPQGPSIDLSKVKISDTSKVLALREALAKKARLEQEALSNTNTSAMIEIGNLYKTEAVGGQDLEQARYWYKKALAAGDKNAEKQLSAVNLLEHFKSVPNKQNQSLGKALAPAAQAMTKSPAPNQKKVSLGAGGPLNSTTKNSKANARKPAANTSTTRTDVDDDLSIYQRHDLKLLGNSDTHRAAQNVMILVMAIISQDIAPEDRWALKYAETTQINELSLLPISRIKPSADNLSMADLESYAEEGYVDAQLVLSERYSKGSNQDRSKQYYWQIKAAEAGYDPSYDNAGFAYALGRGVDKNPEKAAEWYRKSALAGHADGQQHYAAALLAGDGAEKDTQAGIDWYEKSARQGAPDVMSSLAHDYLIGYQMPQNYKRARYWYEKMTKSGWADRAYFNLGKMALDGLGEAKDVKKARELFEKSLLANTDYSKPIYQLALLYLTGHGVPKDRAKAIKLLKRAVDHETFSVAKNKLKDLGVTYKKGDKK